jgi:hypothetical protein
MADRTVRWIHTTTDKGKERDGQVEDHVTEHVSSTVELKSEMAVLQGMVQQLLQAQIRGQEQETRRIPTNEGIQKGLVSVKGA